MKLYEKCILRDSREVRINSWDDENDRPCIKYERNENHKQATGALGMLIKTARDCEEIATPDRIEQQFLDGLKAWSISEDDVYLYLGEEKFVPHIFLNISPNWKGDGDVHALDLLVDQYMRECNRFLEWVYIIENGSEGDMIHAHIVGKINPKYEKSTITHFNKGNHTRQLKKYANKIEGIRGKIEGAGINRMILRTPELIKDKKEYLVEELKPEGHKNLSKIWDNPKLVSLFTVK